MVQQITVPAMKSLKALPYGGAGCVVNPDVDSIVQAITSAEVYRDCLNDLNVQDRFLDEYVRWINTSRLVSISGLNEFPIKAFSNGTSEAFDKFYLKHSQRRFRCFKGEYMYHPASWRNYFPTWAWIEDSPLDSNDAVIISAPFSDTGDVHPRFAEVLNTCDQLNIPVLVDCAFFGIVGNIKLDLNHRCISDITFSLSKSFPVANLRIGMRLTRIDDDDSLLVHKKTNYTNRLGAAVGYRLIRKYSADYNYETWSDVQSDMCRSLGIVPSKSVIFGLDTENRYPEYNRGGATNRLCLAKYLKQGMLPND